MANRISVVIDVAAEKGVAAFKNFRTSIAEAEGAAGKFRAGTNAALQSVQANAGQFAMAAGAALVTFGVKSVQAFQDSALAAGKFSDATGLAVDDASRWIEVSGDLGVSADAVQGAMRKMNKAIADGKPVMDEFGDAIVRSADGTVNSSASFENLVTQIGAIKDPTERAKAAQEAFGKSYGEIAELMSMSATDLKSALASVSDAKVIDETEVAKAKEFRDRLDELKDRLDDVMMTLGEGLVPILSDTAETVSMVADAFGGLNSKVEDLTGSGLIDWANKLRDPLVITKGAADAVTDAFDMNVSASDALGYAWDWLTGNIEETSTAADGLVESIDYNSEAGKKLAEMYRQRVIPATEATAEATRDARDATAEFKDEIDKLYGIQRSAMERQLDFEQSTRDLAEAISDSKASIEDQGDAAIEASEKFATLEGASLDSRDGTLRQIESLQAFADTLAPGSDLRAFLDDYIDRLNDIPAYIDTQVTIGGAQAPPGIGVPDRPGGSGPGTVPGKDDPKPPGRGVDVVRFKPKSATVSQPAASAPVLLGGGITRTVSTRGGGGGGGGSNADDRLMAAMAETGDISQQEYRDYLATRLGEFEKYSDDYMRVWRQINGIDRNQQREQETAAREAQRLADEQARQVAADEAAKQRAADDEIRRTDQIMAAMYEMGQLSLADYQAYLQGRLGAYEQYSAQFMAIWRQLQTLEGGGSRGGGNAASADEVRLAELEAQRLQFIADMFGLDPKRTEEEKLKARIDAANAAERLAKLRTSMTPVSTTANSSNVTINMPPGSNGHDVVAAIQQYEKRNGKSWRS